MEPSEISRPSVSVNLLLKKGGETLLYKRINTRFENGNYSLVGGNLDAGETVQAGMAREAREEAGIDIKPEDLKVVHVMHMNAKEPYGEYFNVFLEASAWLGEPENMEPGRCGDLAWFQMNNLPENTASHIRSALKDIESGVAFSNFGW